MWRERVGSGYIFIKRDASAKWPGITEFGTHMHADTWGAGAQGYGENRGIDHASVHPRPCAW